MGWLACLPSRLFMYLFPVCCIYLYTNVRSAVSDHAYSMNSLTLQRYLIDETKQWIIIRVHVTL